MVDEETTFVCDGTRWGGYHCGGRAGCGGVGGEGNGLPSYAYGRGLQRCADQPRGVCG